MKNKSQIDRLFEQGTSNLSRAPKTPLSDARIAAAASASKSGAGIWLLSHLKEIVVCVVSFATGVGVTLLATHKSNDEALHSQYNENEVVASSDTLNASEEKRDVVNYPVVSDEKNSQTSILKQKEISPTNNRVVTHPIDHNVVSSKQKETAEEPVVVKTVVEKRDTVHIKETITIKDTVYVP
ncbi:MAG: hypothetical protein K6A41_08750 [Bacteroidales bacterium]|nr:hypothetical protein [Bacteroidales bacterium]